MVYHGCVPRPARKSTWYRTWSSDPTAVACAQTAYYGAILLLAAFAPDIAAFMDTKSASGSAAPAGKFDQFPGERATVDAVKKWIEKTELLLTSDQRSLIAGTLPSTLIDYEPLPDIAHRQ